LGYEYLGEHLVKNILKPIRVYQVQMEPGVADSRQLASQKRIAFSLPDKPSIAVLPFVNMSGDPEKEYLADGMTENITAALACISEMFVIARTSVFIYKGKPVKVQQVSEELGVRYVLEGSIQKMGERLRVTAQLIDATTGRHRWAKRYDRDMKDLFTIQDEITRKIVVALEVQLTHGEASRARARTPNLEAWEYVARALSLYISFSKEDNARAQELYAKAVKLDSGYAFAWAGLGWCHFIDGQFGFSASRAQSFKQAGQLAQKALNLDDTEPLVHGLLAHLHLLQRQYDHAIAEGERAIAFSPNNAGMHIILAMIMGYAGRVDEAIELAEKAMRLSPYYPAFYLGVLGRSYRMAGRHEEALAAFKELLNRSRKGEYDPLLPLLGLAASYVQLGHEEQARAYASKVRELYPKFLLEDYRKMTFFKDPVHLQQVLDPLRKLGFK
jgi:adenylate cyclase